MYPIRICDAMCGIYMDSYVIYVYVCISYAYLPFGQLFVIKNGMFVIGHISENY